MVRQAFRGGEYTPSSTGAVATDANGNVYAVGYAMKPLPFLQTDFGGVVASFDANLAFSGGFSCSIARVTLSTLGVASPSTAKASMSSDCLPAHLAGRIGS